MFTKKHLAVVMLAAGGLASGSAWAQTQCGDIDTIGEWADAPDSQCIDQDKLYTLDDATTLPDGDGVDIETLVVGDTDYHTVTFNFADPITADNTPYAIHYTIEIVGDCVGCKHRVFGEVDIDTTAPGGQDTTTATKMVCYDEGMQDCIELVSENGEPDGPYALDPVKKLWVWETFSASGDGIMTSATNTYTEITDTPEPASIALMGLGLAGLGVWRRRNKA